MEFNSYFSVNNEDMPQDLLKSMKKNASDTISVTSKDDPRLKKYQDSLRLYNATKDTFNPKYYNKNGGASWYNFKGTKSDVVKFEKNHKIDSDFEYYRTGKFPGKIQPTSVEDWGEGMAAPVYKKPVQPVKYQKPEPPKAEVKAIKGSKKYFINETEVDEPTFNKIAPIKSMKKNEK